ncbi:hypothetical protein [Limibacillus halophilus]
MTTITKFGLLAAGALALGAAMLPASPSEAIELRPDGAYCLTSKPIFGGHPSVERVSGLSCAYTEEESADVGQQWSYQGGKLVNNNGNCLQEVDAIGGGYKLVVHECAPYRGQIFSLQGATIRTNSGGCIVFDGRSGTKAGVVVGECSGGGQVLNLPDDFGTGAGAQIKGYP